MESVDRLLIGVLERVMLECGRSCRVDIGVRIRMSDGAGVEGGELDGTGARIVSVSLIPYSDG